MDEASLLLLERSPGLDDPPALLSEPLHTFPDILHLEGQQIEPRGMPVEPAANGLLIRERLDQLDECVADIDQGDLQPYFGRRLALHNADAEVLGPELDRSIDVLHCVSDLVDALNAERQRAPLFRWIWLLQNPFIAV